MPAKYSVTQGRDHLLSSNGQLQQAQTQNMQSRAKDLHMDVPSWVPPKKPSYPQMARASWTFQQLSPEIHLAEA